MTKGVKKAPVNGTVWIGGGQSAVKDPITRAENIDVVKAFLASDEGAPFAWAPIGGAPCFNPALKPGSPDAHFAVRLLKAAE